MDYVQFAVDWLAAHGMTAPDEIVFALKKKQRVNGDNPNRPTHETVMERKLRKVLSEQSAEIQRLMGDPPSLSNIPPDFWAAQGITMSQELEPTMQRIYVEQAAAIMEQLPIGVDWALVNQRAIDWARGYTFDLVTGINGTTRENLQRLLGDFFNEPTSIGELMSRLEGTFGPVRAEMIAVTEVTRASVGGELDLANQLQAQGIEMAQVWATNMDDLVCPICGPRDGKAKGEGWTEPPPAHPRCRCWLDLEYRV